MNRHQKTTADVIKDRISDYIKRKSIPNDKILKSEESDDSSDNSHKFLDLLKKSGFAKIFKKDNNTKGWYCLIIIV